MHVLKPLAANASHSNEDWLVYAGKGSVMSGLPLVGSGAALIYEGASHEHESIGMPCCICEDAAKGSDSGESVDTGDVWLEYTAGVGGNGWYPEYKSASVYGVVAGSMYWEISNCGICCRCI